MKFPPKMSHFTADNDRKRTEFEKLSYQAVLRTVESISICSLWIFSTSFECRNTKKQVVFLLQLKKMLSNQARVSTELLHTMNRCLSFVKELWLWSWHAKYSNTNEPVAWLFPEVSPENAPMASLQQCRRSTRSYVLYDMWSVSATPRKDKKVWTDWNMTKGEKRNFLECFILRNTWSRVLRRTTPVFCLSPSPIYSCLLMTDQMRQKCVDR